MFINSCCGSEHHNKNRRFWQCVSFISEGNSFQKISPFVLARTDHVTTFSCRRDLGREYLAKGHGISMISKDSFRTKLKSVPKFRGSVSQEKTREWLLGRQQTASSMPSWCKISKIFSFDFHSLKKKQSWEKGANHW